MLRLRAQGKEQSRALRRADSSARQVAGHGTGHFRGKGTGQRAESREQGREQGLTESGAQVRAESRAQVREPDRAQGRDLVGQISRGYVPRRGGCVPEWDAVSALKYALALIVTHLVSDCTHSRGTVQPIGKCRR